MLRYFSSNRTQTIKTIHHQAEELLNRVAAIDDYEGMLKIILAYPKEVICACQDYMGNTLLHLILSQSSRREVHRKNRDGDTIVKASKGNRNRWRSQKETENEDGRRTTLIQVVQHLIHCIDDSNDELMATNIVENTYITYNSIIRQKSAGGSLPLHIVCRFCSEQQLDIVQYLMERYPYAVHCPDMWGNVPLHEACDVAVVPLEIILVLIKQWPDSTRVCNIEGNLPLHLAAASKATSYMHPVIAMDSSEFHVDNNVDSAIPEQAPVAHKTDDENNDRYTREIRQLEIVQYMIDYWPQSVHAKNDSDQTALQLAIDSNSNPLVIEFLQSMASTIDPPPLPNSMSPRTTNPFDTVDKARMVTSYVVSDKGINPFDDDIDVLVESSNKIDNDEVLVSHVPSTYNIEIENVEQSNSHDDESDNSENFDGVVELAEDYFEVVVDRVHEEEEIVHPYNEVYQTNVDTIEFHSDAFFDPTQ
jgi:ankyrin repeat protein